MTIYEEILQEKTFKGESIKLDHRVFFTMVSRMDADRTIRDLPARECLQRMARVLTALVMDLHERSEWDEAKIDEVLFSCVFDGTVEQKAPR